MKEKKMQVNATTLRLCNNFFEERVCYPRVLAFSEAFFSFPERSTDVVTVHDEAVGADAEIVTHEDLVLPWTQMWDVQYARRSRNFFGSRTSAWRRKDSVGAVEARTRRAHISGTTGAVALEVGRRSGRSART